MAENKENLRSLILDILIKQFPDLDPKIAKITEQRFTYELERHGNYTYYSVAYTLSPSGELTVDWENAQMTMI